MLYSKRTYSVDTRVSPRTIEPDLRSKSCVKTLYRDQGVHGLPRDPQIYPVPCRSATTPVASLDPWTGVSGHK